MSKGATISGIVCDDAGKAMPGAYVSIQRVDENVRFERVKTDGKGSFRVTDLPAGRYQVELHRDGRITRLHETEISTGQEYEVDWDRPGEGEVEGIVTLRGAPVQGATILLYRGGEAFYDAVGSTDANGRYTVSVPKAGKHYVRFAKKGAKSPYDDVSSWASLTITPGKNRLDLVFPGASVSGRVIDQTTGKPMANATIHCYVKQSEQKSYGNRSWWSRQHLHPYWSRERKAKTDAEGRFEISDLPAGECAIALELAGLEWARIPGCTFRLSKDQKKEGLAVRIPEVGSAHIAVTDAETGKALPDIRVTCVDESGFFFYPEVEASCSPASCVVPQILTHEGRTVFANLPPGKYRVFPLTDSYLPAPAHFEVKAGQVTDATLKLRTGGRIVFRLSEPADDPVPGRPWVGFRVTTFDGKPVLEDAKGPYWGGVKFLAGDPPREGAVPIKPGSYRIEAVLRLCNSVGLANFPIESDDNLWTSTQTVDVVDGQDTVIEIPWHEDR